MLSVSDWGETMAKSSRKESKGGRVNDTLFVIGSVIVTAAVATFLGYLVGMYGIQRLTGTGPVPRVRNVEVASGSLTKAPETEVKPQASSSGNQTASRESSRSSGQSVSQSNGGKKQLYRVQVGSFSVRSNADNLVRRLKEEVGLDAIVVGTGPYRVQVGAFGDRSNAERLQQELFKKGYEALVVQ